MAVNKVVLGERTLIDLSLDTATEADVVKGKLFHRADGEQVEGMREESDSPGSGGSDSGGVEWNISYGFDEPEDTTKPWFKTSEPNKVVISEKELTELMPYKLPVELGRYMSCAAVGSKIYTFGGYIGTTTGTSKIYCIDTEKGVSTTCTGVSVGILDGKAIAVGSKIYVMCGASSKSGYTSGSSTHICYDTEKNMTTTLNTPFKKLYGAGCVLVGKYIYVLGGEPSTSSYYGPSNTKTVYRYDTEENTWVQLLTSEDNEIAFQSCGIMFAHNNRIYSVKKSASGSSDEKATCYDIDTNSVSAVEYADVFWGGTVLTDAVSYTFGDRVYFLCPVFSNYLDKSVNGRIYCFDFASSTVTSKTVIPYEAGENAAIYGGTALIGTSLYYLGGQAVISTSSSNAKNFTDQIYKVDLMGERLTEGEMLIEPVNYNGGFKLSSNPDIHIGVGGVYKRYSDSRVRKVDVYKFNPETVTERTNYFTESSAEVESATTLTSQVNCSIGDLVVAAIATRDTLEISDGWTLVSTSGTNSADTTNGQRLSWAWKFAESTMESITVTQASEQRLYINMVALTGATGVTDNGYSYCNTESAGSLTVTKPSGLVLWGMTAPSWGASYKWALSHDMPTVLLTGSSAVARLAVGLDQTDETSLTVTITSKSTFIVGSLSVEGIDEFYHDETSYGRWNPI